MVYPRQMAENNCLFIVAIVVSLSGAVIANHETNRTGNTRGTGQPRLIGFIVPSTGGGRPRVQLMPGAQRFLGPGRRIATARLSQLRGLGVNGLGTRGSNVRPLPLNAGAIVDAARRATVGGQTRTAGRRPNIVFVRPSARNTQIPTPGIQRQDRQQSIPPSDSASSGTSMSSSPSASSSSSSSSSASTVGNQEGRIPLPRSRAELIALIQRRINVLTSAGRVRDDTGNSTSRLRALLRRLRGNTAQDQPMSQPQPRPQTLPVARGTQRVDEAVLQDSVIPAGTVPKTDAVPNIVLVNVPDINVTPPRPTTAGVNTAVPSTSPTVVTFPSQPVQPTKVNIQPLTTDPPAAVSVDSASVDLSFRSVVPVDNTVQTGISTSNTDNALQVEVPAQPSVSVDISPLQTGPAFEIVPPSVPDSLNPIVPSSAPSPSVTNPIDFSMQGTPAGAFNLGMSETGSSMQSAVASTVAELPVVDTPVDTIQLPTTAEKAGQVVGLPTLTKEELPVVDTPVDTILLPTAAEKTDPVVGVPALAKTNTPVLQTLQPGLEELGGKLPKDPLDTFLITKGIDVSTAGTAGAGIVQAASIVGTDTVIPEIPMSVVTETAKPTASPDIPITFDDLDKCMIQSGSAYKWSESTLNIPRTPSTVCKCSCRDSKTERAVPMSINHSAEAIDLNNLRAIITDVIQGMFSTSLFDLSKAGVQPNIAQITKAIIDSKAQHKTVGDSIMKTHTTAAYPTNVPTVSLPTTFIDRITTGVLSTIMPTATTENTSTSKTQATSTANVNKPPITMPLVTTPSATTPPTTTFPFTTPPVTTPSVTTTPVATPPVTSPPITADSGIASTTLQAQLPTTTEGINIIVGDWTGSKKVSSANIDISTSGSNVLLPDVFTNGLQQSESSVNVSPLSHLNTENLGHNPLEKNTAHKSVDTAGVNIKIKANDNLGSAAVNTTAQETNTKIASAADNVNLGNYSDVVIVVFDASAPTGSDNLKYFLLDSNGNHFDYSHMALGENIVPHTQDMSHNDKSKPNQHTTVAMATVGMTTVNSTQSTATDSTIADALANVQGKTTAASYSVTGMAGGMPNDTGTVSPNLTSADNVTVVTSTAVPAVSSSSNTTILPNVTTSVNGTLANTTLSQTTVPLVSTTPIELATTTTVPGATTMDPDLVAEMIEAQEEAAGLAAELAEAAA